MKMKKHPKHSIGTSVYTGIAEDVDVPILRTGKKCIEDVDGQSDEDDFLPLGKVQG
jgi:hypothetical protein